MSKEHDAQNREREMGERVSILEGQVVALGEELEGLKVREKSSVVSSDDIQNGAGSPLEVRLLKVSETLDNIIKRNHLLTADR